MKLLQTMRSKMRLGHFSPRTEDAYVDWVKRFVRYHRLRHPSDLGEREVMQYLTYLAVERQLAASTVAQASAALQYLYAHVIDRPIAGLASSSA